MKNKKIIFLIIVIILIMLLILLHYNDKKAFNDCLKLHSQSYCKNAIKDLKK